MGSDVTASRPTWRTAFALPDSRLSVWEAESSYSAASPIAGIPVGTAGLRPVVTGTPTSTDPIELETMRGGYSDGGAAFRWRHEGGDWLYRVPTPRLSECSIIAHDGSTEVVYMDAAVQQNGRPIIVTSGQATGRRITATRLTEAGTWLPVVVIELTKSSDIIPAIVALPDGSLSIYVDLGGIRRFTSTDDGASWDEVPILLGSNSGGGWTYPGFHSSVSSTVEQLQVAAGSDKMMMLVRDVNELTHYASEDYGSTWEVIASETDVSTDQYRLEHCAAGFLLVSVEQEGLTLYGDPFSATPSVVYDYTGDSIGTPTDAAIFTVDGTVWMVESANASSSIRGRARFHRSLDGGTTWERPAAEVTDNATPLSIADPSAIAACSTNGGAYIFEASNRSTTGFAPGVAAHRLGGWSSHGSMLNSARDVVGWSMLYSPLPGAEPDTDSEVQMDGANPLGDVSSATAGSPVVSSSTGAGLEITGASNGDEARWGYTPEDAVLGWVHEAEVEATAGLFKMMAADGGRRVKLIVDADASTIGLYDADNAADEKDETLIGSTVALPSGVITLRLLLNGDDAGGWYRLAGSPDWVEVATTDSALGSVAGLDEECEILARSETTMDVTVHGWRVLTLSNVATVDGSDILGSSYGPFTSGGVYLDEGQSVQASGFTRYGDAWTSTPSADDGPGQLLPGRPSPRHRFVSDVDTVQVLAFQVAEQEMAPSHALLLQGLNARTCKVDVWTTTAGAWVTYGTVNLYRSWDDYTVLGANRVKLGTSSDAGSASLEHVSAGELVGATFVDSTGALHTVVGNTGGVLPQAGGGGHLGQRAILELDGAPAATGACELWFSQAHTVIHHEKSIVVEGFRLTFTGLVSASPQVASGAMTVGNAVLAPMTWLSEGPDQTRTEVFDVREEVNEQDDGHEYTVRYAPNRRRYELNFARLLPMYAADGGSWDWWEAGDDTEQAATPWTLPQTLSRFLGLAGRRPFVYLPSIPYHSTSGQTLQTIAGPSSSARLVRCVSGAFRLEGVLGQASTADQLVRGSTVTLREVV